MYRLPRALALREQSANLSGISQRPRPPHAFRIPRRQYQQQPQQRWRSQMIYRPNGESMRMQSVRFQKPPAFSMRRLFTLALYTGAVYAYLSLLLRQLDVEIEFVEDEEEGGDLHQESEQDTTETDHPLNDPLYAAEDSTFIPLTWSTKLPRTFYRGSDPEWQEFVRIAKDPQLHKRIQRELVHIVYTGCLQHPSISRQLGSDTKVGKYWLDISFPDGPPPEFERSGIEIGDGFVAWSTQKVDADKQWRVERALVPKAAAEGVWKTAKVLAGIQWRRWKQRLGLEGVDPMSPEERYRMAVEMQRQQQSGAGGKGGGGGGGGAGRDVSKAHTEPDAGVASSANPTTSPTSSSSTTPQQQQPPRSTTSTSTSSDANARKNLPWHIPTIPLPTHPALSSPSPTTTTPTSADGASTIPNPATPPSDLPIAIHVFSHTLSKSWNPKKSEPPRGAFVVQGLVEVRGSRGRMLFDVQSAYDPKGAVGEKGGGGGGQGKFVNVNAGVRGFKRWRQSPRGGP